MIKKSPLQGKETFFLQKYFKNTVIWFNMSINTLCDLFLTTSKLIT
jgi:hypothetical protein